MIKFVFPFILSIFVMIPAYSADLLINFNGNLVDKKCDIKRSDITVQFIPYSLGYIEVSGNISDKQLFKVEFDNCTPTLLNKMISISLNSTNVYKKNNIDYLNTQGGTGLIVGLENTHGELVSFNKPLEVQVESDNTAVLALNAYLTKGDFARPGSLYGTASIIVNYN